MRTCSGGTWSICLLHKQKNFISFCSDDVSKMLSGLSLQRYQAKFEEEEVSSLFYFLHVTSVYSFHHNSCAKSSWRTFCLSFSLFWRSYLISQVLCDNGCFKKGIDKSFNSDLLITSIHIFLVFLDPVDCLILVITFGRL